MEVTGGSSDFGEAQGLCGTGTDKLDQRLPGTLFLEGTSHAKHMFGRDAPNSAGVGKSSQIQQGRAGKCQP